MSAGIMAERQLELFPEQPAGQAELENEAIQKLRDNYQGVVVTLCKGPQTRKLTSSQKAEAIGESGASNDAIMMAKRLFDRRVVARIPQLRKVRDIFMELENLKTDRKYTLPHPAAGTRLLRLGDRNLDVMAEFSRQFDVLVAKLQEATADLEAVWDEVKKVAKEELGKYYSDSDYAFSPRRSLTATYRFVEVGVPSYLEHCPELYSREEERVRREFDEAKQLKEAEMAEEMFQLIDHMVERLENAQIFDDTHAVVRVSQKGELFEVKYQPFGTSRKDQRKVIQLTANELSRRVKTDHRPKRFHDTTVEKLTDSLDYADQMLQELSLGGGQMAQAFSRIRNVVSGSQPQEFADSLRNNSDYRQRVKQRLTQISEFMLDSVITPPRRSVMRQRQLQVRKQD